MLHNNSYQVVFSNNIIRLNQPEQMLLKAVYTTQLVYSLLPTQLRVLSHLSIALQRQANPSTSTLQIWAVFTAVEPLQAREKVQPSMENKTASILQQTFTQMEASSKQVRAQFEVMFDY